MSKTIIHCARTPSDYLEVEVFKGVTGRVCYVSAEDAINSIEIKLDTKGIRTLIAALEDAALALE